MLLDAWRKRGCRLLAALSFAWFSYDAIGRGWAAGTTDFPNYYTAARLALTNPDLERFYDYPLFQRSIDEAGFEQLGGYIPQTPFTWLPFLPLTPLSPAEARRGWLIFNLAFLSLTLWMLSRITRFGIPELWLVAMLSYPALRQNFILGQYYVFLATILTSAVYGVFRSSGRLAGGAFAAAFALKLYGLPFVFFMAGKRQWRTVVTMGIVALIAVAAGIWIFGADGMHFYASQILPPSLAGETLDPFHPANNTMVTMLRRCLIAEPELNAQPIANSLFLFVFLRLSFTLGILLIPFMAAWGRGGLPSKAEFAWWMIATLSISPNTALYTFVLLLIPVTLLVDEYPLRRWGFFVVPYVLLCVPLHDSWSRTFPKVWLLLILFVVAGMPFFGRINRLYGAVAGTLIIVTALGIALLTAKHPHVPAKQAARFVTVKRAIYASAPVVTASGTFYEAIDGERYAIKRVSEGTVDTFATEGNAYHPASDDAGERVYFELVSHGRASVHYFDWRSGLRGEVTIDQTDPHDLAVSHSGELLAFVSHGALYEFDGVTCKRILTGESPRGPSFCPDDKSVVYVTGARRRTQIVRTGLASGRSSVLLDSAGELMGPTISPDGSTLAYAARDNGPWQIWSDNLADESRVQITDGTCNSWAPAWSLDSREVIFASDCNRGLKLPSLWHAPLSRAAADSSTSQTWR